MKLSINIMLSAWLTSQRSEVRYPVRPLTFVSDSADSGRVTGESMCTLVLVTCNRIGGLSLPMNSVVTLTDRPQISMDVSRATKQQQSSSVLEKRQCWSTCKSENNVVSTTTELRRCFSGSVANGWLAAKVWSTLLYKQTRQNNAIDTMCRLSLEQRRFRSACASSR